MNEDKKNYQNNCQSSGGSDTWLEDPIDLKGSSSNYLYYPSVTYRAFGTEYILQRMNSEVYINDKLLDETGLGKKAMKVDTNIKNKKDVFAIYSSGTYDTCKIMIRQVNP